MAIARKYMHDVLSGQIDACKWVRLACERQRNDLESLKLWRFDEKRACAPCWFIENLQHVKGPLAGQLIHLEPWQVFIITTVFGWVDEAGNRRFRRVYVEVPRGNGKALALDTEIPTPSGFRLMKDLKVGDFVFGADGKPCRIIATTEVMNDRPCYEVEFSTGDVIVADALHQWVTDARCDRDRLKGRGGKNAGPKPSIKTTEEISKTLWCRKDRNHRIKVAQPFDVPRKELPLDPYLLGLWLGDGTSSGARFTCADKDIETIERIRTLGFPVRKVSGNCAWSISDGRKGNRSPYTFLGKLKELDEIENKHIPAQYLFASKEQRLELLRGLMDTDGFISKGQGQCEFVQKNRRIAYDVYALIASLGLRPRIAEKEATISGKNCGTVYRILFHSYREEPVFKLSRKVERLHSRPEKRGLQDYRQIVRCDRVESVPVRCIEVDSSDHCYLAGRGFIQTHNSALSSGVALYCLLADGEGGAEVYSLATTREQAGIVFDTAKRMAQMSSALRAAFGCQVLAHSVYVPKTGSSFRALSAEGSTLDGLNVHCGIIDELHAHKTRDVYDVVETATGKRKQSLMWTITTAGSNRAGICFEVRSFVTKVLEKTVSDEQQFGIIYGLDQGDDWTSAASLKKANPNWGISVQPDVVRALQEKAIAMASAANNFKTKHLDIWVSADSSWMDMQKWKAAADPSLSPEDFEGCECVIGLDLATKRDICAAVKLFRRERDGMPHYYVFGRYYLPQETLEASGNSQYSGWSDMGFLTATPGATTDFGQVADDIREDLSRFSVQAVAYDPWQAMQLANTLSDEGAPMLEVRQTVANLSEPMKTLEALVLDGRLHHDGNPALEWMMSNVVAHLDAKDNIYPRKQRPEEKIDGAVALIIALSRFVSGEQNYIGNFDEFVENMAVI